MLLSARGSWTFTWDSVVLHARVCTWNSAVVRYLLFLINFTSLRVIFYVTFSSLPAAVIRVYILLTLKPSFWGKYLKKIKWTCIKNSHNYISWEISFQRVSLSFLASILCKLLFFFFFWYSLVGDCRQLFVIYKSMSSLKYLASALQPFPRI
jgi:hypothetical protein